MSNINMAYLLEAFIMILIIVIGIILFKVKNKKGLALFLSLVIPSFIVLFGATFILERPDIRIKDEIIIEIGTNEKLNMPETFYHFQNITNKVYMKGKINYNKQGEYEVNFKVDTLIDTYSKNVKVIVKDTKEPEIMLQADEDYKQSYNKEYVEPGFTAIDGYEGELTDKVKVTKENIDENNYNIIYEVEDSSGNKVKKIRRVKIIDDISPEITLNGMRNIVIVTGEEYEEAGATAVDEKDGDLTNKVQILGNVDTSKEGTYYITYKVADNSGNEMSTQRIVIVKNKENITASQEDEEIGVIFLTFDDGPSTNITPGILDILKEKNIKATFFVLNYNEEEEQLIKREYEEGHTIGIHGYSHDYSTIYESEEAYMENITKLKEKIKESTGCDTTITRFPGGSSNTISKFNPGIMSRLTKLVLENGYKYFDWNVSSEDAVGAETSEELYNNVINGLSKDKRNFVLMHDFTKNEAILEALPKIIDYGMENGYVFEKITDETPMIKHRVFN